MKQRMITETLKGVAILAVLADHFSAYYANQYYHLYLSGYANGLILVFFLLSGYGLYLSMDKSFPGGRITTRALSRFFVRRAARIYPLYWLALFITPFFQDRFAVLHTKAGLIYYLALPFPHPPRLFWFVAAIIQCYLAAPLLFAILKKVNVRIYLLAIIAATMMSIPVSLAFAGNYTADITAPQWGYFFRYVFLGNILLFALGMALAPLVERYRSRFQNRAILAAALAVMVVALHYSRLSAMLFEYSMTVFALILFASSAVFCLCLLSIEPRVAGNRLLAACGRQSYPLYLFHIAIYGLLADVGIIEAGKWFGAACAVIALSLVVLAGERFGRPGNRFATMGRQGRDAIAKRPRKLDNHH